MRRDLQTITRLYNPARILCNYEDAEPEAREVLWQMMRGEAVLRLPAPSGVDILRRPQTDGAPRSTTEDDPASCSGKGAASNPTTAFTATSTSGDHASLDFKNASAGDSASPPLVGPEVRAGCCAHSTARSSGVDVLENDEETNEENVNASRDDIEMTSSAPTCYVLSPTGRRSTTRALCLCCDMGSINIELDSEETRAVADIVERAHHDLASSAGMFPNDEGGPRACSLLASEILRRRLTPGRETDFKVRTLIGHGRPIRIVGLSADNRMLVSGDGVEGRQVLLRCVNPTTGYRIGSLMNRGYAGDAPCDMSFTANSQLLVTCDQSDSVMIWDMTNFRCKKSLRLEGFDNNDLFVIGVRMSPDCQCVVAAAEQISEDGANSGRVLVRQLQKKATLIFKEHPNIVLCAEVSPDSKWVVSGSRDGTLFVWDIVTGAVRFHLESHLSGIRCCSFSPCGSYILSLDSKMLCLWCARTGTRFHTLSVDSDKPASTDGRQGPSKLRFTTGIFIPTGLILVGYSSRWVRILDPFDLSEVFSFSTRATVTCASASYTGVALGDFNGNIYCLDMSIRQAATRRQHLSPLARAASTTPLVHHSEDSKSAVMAEAVDEAELLLDPGEPQQPMQPIPDGVVAPTDTTVA